MIRALVLGATVFALLALSGGCPPATPSFIVLPADEDVPTDGSVPIISVMIDAEQEDTAGLKRLTDAMLARGLPATVYVSGDYANRNAAIIQDLYNHGFEIAMHGYNTGEQLATMTYEDQKDLLTRALKAVSGCIPCGLSRPVTGFRPQYFSQNEDTYKVIDELGLRYNSGFKAGQLPFAGHAEQRAPFHVPGHGFVAIPVTTVDVEGSELNLCDISCALSENLSADKFKAALTKARQECKNRKVPMVANFHGWYTGDAETYAYWQPFVDFIDEAIAAGSAFVRSRQLAALYNGS